VVLLVGDVVVQTGHTFRMLIAGPSLPPTSAHLTLTTQESEVPVDSMVEPSGKATESNKQHLSSAKLFCHTAFFFFFMHSYLSQFLK